MTDLGGARAAAGPVVTGTVGAGVEGASVGMRARQDVVDIWPRVADAVDDLAFFGERELFEQVAAALCFDQRVAVKLRLIPRDEPACGVIPGTVADAVACAHRGLAG